MQRAEFLCPRLSALNLLMALVIEISWKQLLPTSDIKSVHLKMLCSLHLNNLTFKLLICLN